MVTLIIISDKIYINLDLLGRHITELCEKFSYSNPLYFKNKNMGFSTAKTPRLITNYTWATINNKKYLVIPRGSMHKLKEFMMLRNIPAVRTTDQRLSSSQAIDFYVNDDITFSVAQNRIKAVLVPNEGGLIQMSCGGGKSIAMLSVIQEIKQPTIIVVHTEKLQKQWLSVFRNMTHGAYTLGELGGKKKKDGDVVVSLVKSLYNKCFTENGETDFSYVNKFGMLIHDECLDPNTVITVPEGLKFLRDIKVGDRVCTPDGKYAMVKNKWVTNKEAYRYISTEGRSLVASENHLVPNKNKHGDIRDNNYDIVPISQADHLLNINNKLYKDTDGSSLFISSQIQTVEKVGKIDLIDIELDNEEKLFIANGFVVHNCHHASAKTFKDVIDNASCKYKIGVTATATRHDGLHFLMNDSFGPILLDISANELKDRITDFEFKMVNTDIPISIPSRTFWAGKGKKVSNMDFTQFVEVLTTSEARNELICTNVTADIKIGHKVIILTNRIEHAKLLHEMLSKDHKGYLVIYETNKSVDLNVIKHDESFEFIVANREIASEGLDIPPLSSLHSVIPSTNYEKIKQQLGRIRRTYEGKLMPCITDYVDNQAFVISEKDGETERVPIFLYTAKKRAAYFIKLKKEYHM